MKDIEKLFHEYAASNNVAGSDLQAAGHQLYDFVKTISNNSNADRGAGIGVYDIWFEYGDKKLFLTLRES